MLKSKRGRFTAILSFALLLGAWGAKDQGGTQNQDMWWFKIRAKDKFERSQIADTGVSIESVVGEWAYGYGTSREKRALQKMGVLELALSDIQPRVFSLSGTLDFPPKDSNFHNYTELTAELQKLVGAHPEISTLSSIGRSIEGREIWVVRISSNMESAINKPGIIFMGGHHAREHLSVELPLEYIQMLLEGYAEGDPRIQSLVNSRDIHIIPVVNPDGIEYDVEGGRYRMWRKNRRQNSNGTYGVDLNRNYGFMWGTGGSSKDPNSDVYMGPKAFSEPETQAVKLYVESHRNATILLSFHTFSELILYPWGHKYDSIENARAKQVHETMASRMAEWNGYTPQQSSDLYIASGDTTDWSYGALGMISFTFELDPRQSAIGGGGFYPDDEVIPMVVQKNLEPVLYLIEYADNPFRVLDARIGPILPSEHYRGQ